MGHYVTDKRVKSGYGEHAQPSVHREQGVGSIAIALVPVSIHLRLQMREKGSKIDAQPSQMRKIQQILTSFSHASRFPASGLRSKNISSDSSVDLTIESINVPLDIPEVMTRRHFGVQK